MCDRWRLDFVNIKLLFWILSLRLYRFFVVKYFQLCQNFMLYGFLNFELYFSFEMIRNRLKSFKFVRIRSKSFKIVQNEMKNWVYFKCTWQSICILMWKKNRYRIEIKSTRKRDQHICTCVQLNGYVINNVLYLKLSWSPIQIQRRCH